MIQVRQGAQLADSQIVSVRKKMLEICHCMKGFSAEGCSCPCRSITGGRKGNQLTKFSSTKWEDRGTCASSLRLAPRWRETKINLVLLPGYYRPGISQQAFSKASIDVLWQCLCCSVYVYPLNYGYHLPVLIEGIILACTARIYYHP